MSDRELISKGTYVIKEWVTAPEDRHDLSWVQKAVPTYKYVDTKKNAYIKESETDSGYIYYTVVLPTTVGVPIKVNVSYGDKDHVFKDGTPFAEGVQLDISKLSFCIERCLEEGHYYIDATEANIVKLPRTTRTRNTKKK